MFNHNLIFKTDLAYNHKVQMWWLVYIEGECQYCLICKKFDSKNPQNKKEVFAAEPSTRLKKECLEEHIAFLSAEGAGLLPQLPKAADSPPATLQFPPATFFQFENPVVVGCKPYSFCFNSYVGEGIKKLNDFLQNQSHPPTVEVAKEWKRRLTGADGKDHENPCVCKLLDMVGFVTHRQFGARSLLTHFCVIRSALKKRLTEVSGLIDEYIEIGGKRDFAEIIKHGLNEEGNKRVQYV